MRTRKKLWALWWDVIRSIVSSIIFILFDLCLRGYVIIEVSPSIIIPPEPDIWSILRRALPWNMSTLSHSIAGNIWANYRNVGSSYLRSLFPFQKSSWCRRVNGYFVWLDGHFLLNTAYLASGQRSLRTKKRDFLTRCISK